VANPFSLPIAEFLLAMLMPAKHDHQCSGLDLA